MYWGIEIKREKCPRLAKALAGGFPDGCEKVCVGLADFGLSWIWMWEGRKRVLDPVLKEVFGEKMPEVKKVSWDDFACGDPEFWRRWV